MALNVELDSPEDARRVFAGAIAAGATEATELKCQFWQSEGEICAKEHAVRKGCLAERMRCVVRLACPKERFRNGALAHRPRGICAGSMFGAIRDPWGFRWSIDYESEEDRQKYAVSLAKQIAAVRAAEAKPVGRD